MRFILSLHFTPSFNNGSSTSCQLSTVCCCTAAKKKIIFSSFLHHQHHHLNLKNNNTSLTCPNTDCSHIMPPNLLSPSSFLYLYLWCLGESKFRGKAPSDFSEGACLNSTTLLLPTPTALLRCNNSVLKLLGASHFGGVSVQAAGVVTVIWILHKLTSVISG